MFEAEHRWVSRILDDLASGELYWDRETIAAVGRGPCSERMGSFPGIPRLAIARQDLPP